MTHCGAICKNGNQCTSRSKPNSNFCGKHDNPSRGPAPVRPKQGGDDDDEDGGIVNVYEIMDKEFLPHCENPNFDLHKIELPARICTVSASGGGKTCWLWNFLKRSGAKKGTFSSITIVCAERDEPIYNFIVAKNPQVNIVEGIRNTPLLKDLDPKENHLVVFDDMVTGNQEIISDYYMRARKRNCTVIFLSQSYYDIDPFIRKNANYLVLLRLSGIRDTRLIMSESSSGVKTKDQLMRIYDFCTATPLTPLVIHLGANVVTRFRKGFGKAIDPSNFE